jgi:hypothetical protein
MRTLRILLVIVAVAAVPIIATAQASHYTFTSIANLVDYGGYFEPATITNRGEVLFAPALLPPPAGPGGEGVLLWRAGVLTTIAAAGQPAPGGGIFGYTESPVQMNDHGDVAFIMTRDYLNLPPPTGFNAGVYRYNSRTGIVPVMLPGTPAPGGGSFWGSFFVVNINNRGDIYFPGMICTTVTVSFPTQSCPDGSPGVLTYGAYKADAKGRISPLVVPGDAAPGGSYFDFTHGPATNVKGDVAFTGHVFSDPCGNPGLLSTREAEPS